MVLKSKHVLSILGYEVDKKGNVSNSTNQIAIVSLENEAGGGILRVHGSDDQFFYSGDLLLQEKELLFPSRITPQYVYFQGRKETLRVKSEEFVDNAIRALAEYNKLSNKNMSG